VRRELFTPFVDGARLGAWVAGPALLLSLVGAVGVLAFQSDDVAAAGAPPEVTVAALDAPHPSTVVVRKAPLDEHEIDPALLRASRLARTKVVGGVPFQLAVEAPPASPEPPPPAEVAAAAAAAPAAVAAPAPLIIQNEALYEAVEAVFPENTDTAYAIVMCESSGNARAMSRGGRYFGLWQFDLPTWASVGGSGLPSDASVEEQMMRARMLYDARGWSPWGCAY